MHCVFAPCLCTHYPLGRVAFVCGVCFWDQRGLTYRWHWFWFVENAISSYSRITLGYCTHQAKIKTTKLTSNIVDACLSLNMRLHAYFLFVDVVCSVYVTFSKYERHFKKVEANNEALRHR